MLVDKYKSNKDIRFIALARRKSERLLKFLEKIEFKFEQKFLSENSQSVLRGGFGRTIICNKNGEIIYDMIGRSENHYKNIDNVIKTVLRDEKLYFLE